MTADNVSPNTAPASAIARIRELDARRLRAMLDGDVDTLSVLFADTIIYTHSDGSRDDKAEYIAKIADGRYDYHAIDHEIGDVVLFGTTAVVHGRMVGTVDVDGMPRALNTSTLSIWSLGEPTQQIVAFAATAIKQA